MRRGVVLFRVDMSRLADEFFRLIFVKQQLKFRSGQPTRACCPRHDIGIVRQQAWKY